MSPTQRHGTVAPGTYLDSGPRRFARHTDLDAPNANLPLMGAFSEAVEQVQVLFRETASDDDYLFAPERREEAEQVQPCVARFVHGEMDPTRRMTASRTPFPGSPPSMAEKLGSKLERAPAETADAVRTAITKAIAIGYLATCETEPRGDVAVVAERSVEDIWDFWGPSCRDKLEEVGVPASWAKMVRQMGTDSLVADLKALGLTRWLGGSKLNQLGLLYAQAGVLLRFAQTSNIPSDRFQEVVAQVRQDAKRPWRFDAYPV